MRLRHSKTLGGILLVSGTTIGAGMLALPVVTGIAGFLPTVCLFLLYWAFMTYTAFLLLELNLWLGDGVNLLTMAKKTLGKGGEVVAWITYLFLLYLLTTAYLAGGGPILLDLIQRATGINFPPWTGALPLLLVFGFFIYKGTRYVDGVNRIMMIGLAIAYLTMIFWITPNISLTNLVHTEWHYGLISLSLIATSFGYHIIIPTLTTYMHHNVKELKRVILIGSLVPLLVYIVWEAMTLGVIPVQGEDGIVQGYSEGINGIQLLTKHLKNSGVIRVAECFSFFAIVTSFLGVTLSLSDFLADGFKIEKTGAGKALLLLLTFAPPLVFIFTYPRAFFTALEFAGAFGVIVLLGLMPPLMTWFARYRVGMRSPYTTPGGKIALISAMGISLFVISVELMLRTGFLEKMLFNR